MPDWPRTFHPLDEDGQPDQTRTVEVFLHRPDLTEALLAWTGGEQLVVNGGPAVLLPGTVPATQRLVGLGDFAARVGETKFRRELADGFATRYQPADS